MEDQSGQKLLEKLEGMLATALTESLEILEWGDRQKSLALLIPRGISRYSHIRKMIASLREQLQGGQFAPVVAASAIVRVGPN